MNDRAMIRSPASLLHVASMNQKPPLREAIRMVPLGLGTNHFVTQRKRAVSGKTPRWRTPGLRGVIQVLRTWMT